MNIASCVRTLVCPAEWIREGSRTGLFASAGKPPPRLRSRTTPRADDGRANAYHHRAVPATTIATLFPDRAFISGCVTRDNASRHSRYSAAGVSIGTERASITTTTNATADRPSWRARACAMHARPSRRCEIAAISRTRCTLRRSDAGRWLLTCRVCAAAASVLTVSSWKSAKRQQRSGRTPTPYTCIQAEGSAIGGSPWGTRHGGPTTAVAIGRLDT